MQFTNNSLLRPETNIQIGMAYFKELSTKFGGTHYALAGYNAGDSRVAQWMAERPGISQDEFVDDIPFPETQQYVKRILGTAEDYRRLFGGGLLEPGSAAGADLSHAAQAQAGEEGTGSPGLRQESPRKEDGALSGLSRHDQDGTAERHRHVPRDRGLHAQHRCERGVHGRSGNFHFPIVTGRASIDRSCGQQRWKQRREQVCHLHDTQARRFNSDAH
jgi:hypothetical protein